MGDAGTMSVLAQDTLTGAGVQTVTGAKTFNNQTLVARNPAGTFSGTWQNPPVTANVNLEYIVPGSYHVYIAGSNTKRLNLLTKAVEDTNTDAFTVLQATITALGNTSGKILSIANGFYPLTGTLDFTGCNGFCTLKGESGEGVSQLRPTTNIPAISVSGKACINFDGLYLSHNQPGYTSNLLEIKNGCTRINTINCSFYDFGQAVGTAYYLDATTASIYKNKMQGCHIDGFDIQVKANVGNSSFFANSNFFKDTYFWNFKTHILNVTSVASGAFDSNNFANCIGQTKNTSSSHGFNYDTNHVGHSFYTMHDNVMVWDLPAAANYAQVNSATDMTLLGCVPTYKMGGSGVNAGKIRAFDNYSLNRNTSTQSGNASTKVFNIAHNLNSTPRSVRIAAGSLDAIGPFYITKDATNITITFPTAPPTGTNNLVFNWEAALF